MIHSEMECENETLVRHDIDIQEKEIQRCNDDLKLENKGVNEVKCLTSNVDAQQNGITDGEYSEYLKAEQDEKCEFEENDDTNEDNIHSTVQVSTDDSAGEHQCQRSIDMDRPPNISSEGLRHDSCKKYNKNPPRASSKSKRFFCSECNKSFNRKSNLMVHEKIHTGEPREKSFVCSVCNKTFGTKSNLHCHIRIHTGEKPFKCTMCDKAFTVSSSLHAHVRIHTGERPYVCDVCGKGFTECSQLQKHRRNHTGERPYKCQICFSAFTQKSSLDSHMKMHTGDKPFKCSICGKVCRTSSEVQVHMRTHTGERPYKCSVCDTAFSRPDSVEKHMRTHTGEKPYRCEVCQKSFTVSSALHRHLKTHTGEKPYKCKICDKTFGESGNLNKHMRKVHKCRNGSSNSDVNIGNCTDMINSSNSNSNDGNEQVAVFIPPHNNTVFGPMSIPVFPGNESLSRLYISPSTELPPVAK